jgi:1-phosphatidylinositol phosphodiesterase
MPPTIARGFGWPNVGLGIEGVNARVAKWLLGILGNPEPGAEQKDGATLPLRVEDERFGEKSRYHGGLRGTSVDEARVRGWVMMDFYADPEQTSLVPLLIECNFRGRKSGQEGWP